MIRGVGEGRYLSSMDTPTAYTVRPATHDDALAMEHVEAQARALLEAQGVDFGRLTVDGSFTEDTPWDLAVVATIDDAIIGMARCTALNSELLCLDQVSVAPTWAQQGIGTRLLVALGEVARRSGFRAITGTTFADVVFNGPFYQRLGAMEDPDPHPVMAERRAVERSLGLDDFGRRIVMRIPL